MKKIRIVFIILTISWMIAVFGFSHQTADKSTSTSSYMTKVVASLIYGDNLTKSELELKIQELDPIIRKYAHYILYTAGGFVISTVIFTYDMANKKRTLISQITGSIYAVTDEIHQYFIPRKSMSAKRCTYRLSRSIYWDNITVDFTKTL